MVHALTEAWRVLKPDGLLIDLRPIRSNQEILLTTDDNSQHIAYYTDAYRHQNDLSANDAIETALSENLFAYQSQADFPFIRHFDTAQEFRDYCANRYPPLTISDAIFDQLAPADTSPEIQVTFTTKNSLKCYQRLNLA
ncbi:MAG: hypothetical protein AAF846_13015 [Chloroflexota bacterium]